MGIVTTSLTPTPAIFGYSTLAGAVLDRSSAPRGEVVFSENNATITAGAVGDSQLVAVSMVLPQNYAYVLADLFFEMQAVDQGDWDTEALCVINATDDQGLKFNLRSTGTSKFTSTLLARSYAPVVLPKAILRPVGMGTSVSINVSNRNLDGLISGLTLYARFLQYDIAQHHDVAVNLPSLTR